MVINVQVLSAGDDAFALNTLDVLAGVDTGEERASSVPPTSGISRKINHRTKTLFYRLSITRFLNAQRQRGWHSHNIDTLASELLPLRLPMWRQYSHRPGKRSFNQCCVHQRVRLGNTHRSRGACRSLTKKSPVRNGYVIIVLPRSLTFDS